LILLAKIKLVRFAQNHALIGITVFGHHKDLLIYRPPSPYDQWLPDAHRPHLIALLVRVSKDGCTAPKSGKPDFGGCSAG
jgi:hypothetical protein